jgi:hypothetical protein
MAFLREDTDLCNSESTRHFPNPDGVCPVSYRGNQEAVQANILPLDEEEELWPAFPIRSMADKG